MITKAPRRRQSMQADQLAPPIHDATVELALGHDDTVAFRIPSALECGLMMVIVRIALKTAGFARTQRWIRGRVEATPERSTVELAAIATTEYAVAMAGALYPGRALCLEQSLVLYYLLRRQGVPVRFAMGVQAHPFSAHAWVEYRGAPINDVAEHVKHFVGLPDTLP
jgi:hypothetical protein